MKFLLGEHISTAWHSLRTNRMRIFLTTIGIAIGVASVTTILSLAYGVSSAVTKQIDDIGGNVAVIRPGAEEVELSEALINPVAPEKFNTSTLDETDVEVIQRVDKNLSVAPIMTIIGTLKASDASVKSGLVVASTPDLVKTTALNIDQGQFLDDVTNGEAAVIGQELSLELFGTENPLGSTVKVRNQTFTIVGTLKRQNNPVNYNNVDFDKALIINLKSGKLLNQGRSQIQQINVSTTDSTLLNKSIDQIRDTLTKRHGEKDFTIATGRDVAKPTNRLFTVIAGVMTAIAAISLVVGGIGIMNIMLVSVAERTREIGIRKSIGASDKNIVMQFLVETLMISLLGGLLGYIAGITLAFSIATMLYFTPLITWEVALIALGISVAIGLMFGLYPAIRAARKDPIESLRQYR